MAQAVFDIGALGTIAVLLGGDSSERDISLQSGAAVVAALQSLGANAEAVDTADAVVETLQALRPDFAFIALHGRGGEDGSMQSLLEKMAIPYSGSAVLGSALAMDKVRAKTLWRGLSLPTPDFARLDAESDFDALIVQLGGVAVVKPVGEGSSLGMSIARDADQLRSAYSSALQYSAKVFAEQYIVGPEYTVAILQGRDLPSIRIETARRFYDFAAKYQDETTDFSIPSGLSAVEEAEIQQLAKTAFVALDCRQWGRVDFMREQHSGQFYLLEANTVPGLTAHSLVPMAAQAAGLDFAALIAAIIQLSVGGSGRD